MRAKTGGKEKGARDVRLPHTQAKTQTQRVKNQRTFLRTAKQAKVDLNKVGPRKKLHNYPRCDDRTDTELYGRSTVRREDNTHLTERVGRVGGHDAI